MKDTPPVVVESRAEGGHSKHQQAAVSFRDDVVFADTARSGLSISSGGDDSASTSSNKFRKLHSSLVREQTNRDPLYFYKVTRNLGSGSMGDVRLVKKRADKIGGSARRDVQQAVKRQKRQEECLSIPVLGGIFSLCIDADLKDTSSPSNSRHSFVSLLGDQDDDMSESGARSFEDSLLSDKGSEKDIVYAMKSILLNQVSQQAFIDELRNEIAILRDLDHPNIVRAIETFEFRGQISIVMEVCSGGDLYSRDPYTESEAARIVTAILSAIAYMHSRGVVHRDLKFENCLFVNSSPLSEVKLIDFGLSKVYAAGDQKLTDVSGTIYTMAPETIMGQHTEKADLWSVGVIAYMLLASALPFHGKQRKDVIRKILKNKYSFKYKRWRNVSDQAKDFIVDLLVLDPDERADAEKALGSPWLNPGAKGSSVSVAASAEEEAEELAKESMVRYSSYPKLKKMALMVVAHKSSSDEIGILRKLFRKYASRDGTISFELFCKVMNGSSDEDLRNMFDAIDLSGSGTIGYTEFIAATIEAHGTISEARLAEAFDRLDSDDSGFITVENLRGILGEDVPTAEIDNIIAEVDVEKKDSGVSYSEFIALWEDQQQGPEKESQVQLESAVSSITVESDGSVSDEHTEFLKEKHLQNTLHTWALEMQLPAQEFARGCSFLHQVALGNQFDLEKILEERPALVNFRDYDRRTALHVAASEGLVDICEFLIKKGARINRSDRWGGFPLDDAHRYRHAGVVSLLSEHGAKFGSTSQTVNLITAASEGNIEEVKTLLEFGSMDLNQGDYDHRTALHLAANEGHLEVVKLLCSAGADVTVRDRWGEQPLDDARKAKKNSAAIMKILSGSSIVDSSNPNTSKMHDLKDQALPKTTVNLLVENNDEGMTELSPQEFAMGCSLLHQAALGNQIVLEMILLERPKLVNFRDYDRRTALHVAASEGQVDMCRYLVEKGARINRVDRWGGSPLDDAHRERHVEVVKFLRDQGAKFGSTSQVTNFITAASEGDVDEVQAFLDFGSINLNQGDYDNRTALHLAAGEGHLEVVRMLCEAGADVNVEDRWRNRPLDEAKNSSDIVKLLVQYGAKSTNIVTKMVMALSSVVKSGQSE